MNDYARAAVKSNTSLQLLNAVQSLVLSLGLCLIVCLAGWQLIHHSLSPGAMTACILIVQQVYAPLGNLGGNYRTIRQAFVDMEAGSTYARRCQRSATRRMRTTCAAPASGLRRATSSSRTSAFRHTARSVGLDDVSFKTPPGTTTALVGPSGAGKTTIVRLALRLIDPQEGGVRVDGADLTEVRQRSVRRAVSLVPQEVALFNESLADNVAFGNPEASEADIWKALEAARAGGLRGWAALQAEDPGRRAWPEMLPSNT